MCFLGAKYAKNASLARALPRTPLGGAYSAHQTLWLDLRGLLLRGGEGREEKGREESRGEGKGRWREEKMGGAEKGYFFFPHFEPCVIESLAVHVTL